ncbi:hypothetical protein [Phocaeicola coprocola]|uniref:hypothetical protein n=1 Tax=Phocaeicola coprocola TaxID=310298 RepID=UPI002675A462|nr:hypothetical protein [Phocaeicola coprocola]
MEHKPGKLYRVAHVRTKYGLINTTEAAERGKGVLIAPHCLCSLYIKVFREQVSLPRFIYRNMNTTYRSTVRSGS